MPIKKDGTGKRSVEMEVLVPGTPEQVWQAMATGAGNTAWFTRTTVEERSGGEIRFDFGANGSSVGEVTAWEPPHRFGYVEHEWNETAPPVATEVTITGRSGDQCVVRMVHSLFSSSDDWDDQLEGFEKGWPAFFDILRIYLAHFAGRPAGSFMAITKVDGDHLAIWKRLTSELGLSGADAGEQRTTSAQPQALSGVIARVQQDQEQRVIVMRLQSPPGAALIGTSGSGAQINVSVALYFYGGDTADLASASEQKWRSWVGEWTTAFRTAAAVRT
jgi:uncharacterized protein YndB with AHSA1/START domain